MKGIKCEAKTVATNSLSLFLLFLHYSNDGSILICTDAVQEVRYYVSEEESIVKIPIQVSSIYRCYLIPWDWIRLPRERGREGSQINTENLWYLEVMWRKEIPPMKQEDTVSENFRSPIFPMEYPFSLLFIHLSWSSLSCFWLSTYLDKRQETTQLVQMPSNTVKMDTLSTQRQYEIHRVKDLRNQLP